MKQRHIAILATLSTCLFACVNQNPGENSGRSITSEETPRLFTEHSAADQDDFKKCGVDRDEYYRLMTLPIEDFDQDFEGGWRTLDYKQGCKGAAARLLKSYLAEYEYTYERQHNQLEWHRGQVLASSGNYDEALAVFKRTYKDGDDEKAWNLYVDGTIAFLKKDKSALQATRDKLAKVPVPEKLKDARRKFLKDNPNITMRDGFIDDPGNLYVLEDFIKCFHESYAVAYGKCEK